MVRVMTSEQVLWVAGALSKSGIPVWLDGGWGVDALLGEQTRDHSDLDVVIALADVGRASELLRSQGFQVTEDQRPVRYVLRHETLGQVDFHPVAFDEKGDGWQALPDGGAFCYPATGFSSGSVAARTVPALSAEVQMLTHTGYEPTEKDIRDVLLMHRRLRTPVPEEYQPFLERKTT